MATINKETRDKIIAQALNEIQFARTYKQGKIKNWQKNEDLYYGRKQTTADSRANVDLGRMQEFVHSLLSKIDNPLTFKFTKRKESQLKRIARANALKSVDQERDHWDMKDLVGKKQGVIYGRAVYSYFADSENGYTPHLDNIDVYDFLIDPSAGGIDIEKADYLGDFGVIMNKKQLKAGVKDGTFLKTETNNLIDGIGNAGAMNQEETNKLSRNFATNVTTSQRQISAPDKFKFWRWGTTFEGDRYYLLLSEQGATAIRVDPIEEVFDSGLWWYWSWAAFPDLTEFWTPSYCDYVREIFMAQAVSVNQSLDNGQQVNKPQKVVNVGAIENLAELKYRPDGYIKVKESFDVEKAVQTIRVPSIDTPIKLFELLEGIQEKASGVTSGAKGVSEDTKVGIYEGNQAAAADRFGLLNKSYSFGYKRFALLWEHGVREHLVKKVAVDIIGPDGIDIELVSRKDIFDKDRMGVMVEASNAETAISTGDKKNKLDFLTANIENPVQNPKKAYETAASIVGFTEEEIRQLQDVSEYGDAELMSEAQMDIERILDGEKVKPNRAANDAYKQYFVHYMQDHDDDLDPEQFRSIANYVLLLDQVITENRVRQTNEQLQKIKTSMPPMGIAPGGAPAPGGGAPVITPGSPAAPAAPGGMSKAPIITA